MKKIIEVFREWQKSWDLWDGKTTQPKSVEEVIEPMLEDYANQKVIEELGIVKEMLRLSPTKDVSEYLKLRELQLKTKI